MSTNPFQKFRANLDGDVLGLRNANYLQREDGIWIPQKGSNDGAMYTQLTGSNMEYYGSTIEERPPADSVPVGAIYKAIDTEEFWQSNGVSWVVI